MYSIFEPSARTLRRMSVALIYPVLWWAIDTAPADQAPMPVQALESLPCSKFLIAIGTSSFATINDALTDYVAERGNRLGSAANIVDYVATECRLNESLAVGKAVKNLLVQEKEGRLPAIPIGGATGDPDLQRTWKAFDRWIHHQGPRPELAVSSGSQMYHSIDNACSD